MPKTSIFLLFICISLIDVQGQEIPEVKFNHLYFVLEPEDLKAIRESGFVNDTLAACETRTTRADNQSTWTGTYLFGESNYLEFFETSGDNSYLGYLGIGFSVDKAGELKKLKSSLDNIYNTGMAGRERNLDSVNIPWFDALFIIDSVFLSQSHFGFWIMEYKTEYFVYNNYIIDNDKLTRENYLKKYSSERRNKIVKRFSGIIMKLSIYEKEYIIKFFDNIDYERINENEYLSPDNFRFVIKDRCSGDQQTIESIIFETTNELHGEKNVKISDNISITIQRKEGHITFK